MSRRESARTNLSSSLSSDGVHVERERIWRMEMQWINQAQEIPLSTHIRRYDSVGEQKIDLDVQAPPYSHAPHSSPAIEHAGCFYDVQSD
jgi:hypothetical protein